MSRNLAFQWGVSSFFGWGVYGLNLALHSRGEDRVTASLCPLAVKQLGVDPGRLWALRDFLAASQRITAQLMAPGTVQLRDAVVLHALGNNLNFAALAANNACVYGQRTLGVAFLEDSKLDDAAVAKAARYERLIAGSHWNEAVLKNRGIENVDVVIQGIDPTLFHPAARADIFRGRFAIFSGGKLEFRKGQDIVLRAFRQFRLRHPEALLVTAWHSPWSAGLAASLSGRPGLAPVPIKGQGQIDILGWVAANNIPPEAVLDLGAVQNAQMPTLLREMDVAVFPNRCEGGTNLVAMEAMACGLPVVLSDNTGHRDILREEACFPLRRQTVVESANGQETEGWGESDPEELVEALEQIYQDRALAAARGAAAAQDMTQMSWARSIDRLMAVLG